MTSLNRTLLVAAKGAAGLALSALNASTDIACTGDVCWHAHERYTHPPMRM